MSTRIEPAGGSDILGAKVLLPDHVVYRAFAKETVILNLHTARYHGLNPTAGRMLEVLQGAERVTEAVATLSEEYGRPVEEIERDVIGLCTNMLERDLIELVPV